MTWAKLITFGKRKVRYVYFITIYYFKRINHLIFTKAAHSVMAGHNRTGAAGEKMAATYLIKKGFTILAYNYRYQRAEIDLIAQKATLLVFVEVKTRTTNQHGFPEEAVTQKKINLFLLAAEEFIHQSNWQYDIRFDVIAISGTSPTSFQIHHIEDAFH